VILTQLGAELFCRGNKDELGVAQNIWTGEFVLIRGQERTVAAGRGEIMVIHTHPTAQTNVGSGLHETWNPGGLRDFGHFKKDVTGRSESVLPGRASRSSTEAVVDWSGTITYFDNLGIVPANRVSSQFIRDGHVVGYSEKALREYRDMLLQRYRELVSASSRTAEEERLFRVLEQAIPERYR
jgi:hypothetical protein